MHARERIVRDCFAEQACSHCGTHYPPESVVVLARRRTAWMVLASCDHCQRRGIFVVTFPAHGGSGIRALADASASSSGQHPLRPSTSDDALLDALDTNQHLPSRKHHTAPVAVSDVDAMHAFLTGFNGDFQSLFSSRRAPSSSDDDSLPS